MKIKEDDDLFNFTDKLFNDLTNKEPLYVFIKGHLYLESIMNTMLDSFFPCGIKIDIFNFAQKTELISGIGFIDSTEKSSILKINRVRNNLAHNLDLNIDEKVVEEVLSTFPKNLKDNVIEHSNEFSVTKLTSLFYILISHLVMHSFFPRIKFLKVD